MRQKWGRHCEAHDRREQRTGDPTATNVLKGELRPFLKDARKFIAAHREHPGIVAAISLLLKSNWTVGHYESDVQYTYEPEVFLRLCAMVRDIYREVLGVKIYATLTQGSNEYSDDGLTHTSKSGNHISLNSLGLPFAQLMEIDGAARSAVRGGVHEKFELYMDKLFFSSLRLKGTHDKNSAPRNSYRSPMSVDRSTYVCGMIDEMLALLDPEKESAFRRRIAH